MNIQVTRREHQDGQTVMIDIVNTSNRVNERIDKDGIGVPDATVKMLGIATRNAALITDETSDPDAWLRATLLVLDNRADRDEFLELLYNKLR